MRVLAVVAVVMGIAVPWAGGSACAADADTQPGGPPRVEPAPLAAASTAASVRCLGVCAEEYGRCVQRDEAKHPGVCGSTAMRCRNRCPLSPPRPARVEREAGQAAGRVDEVERSGSAALKKRRHAAAGSAKPPITTRPAQDTAVGSSARTVNGVAAPERAPEPERAAPAPAPPPPPSAAAPNEGAGSGSAAPAAPRPRRNLLATAWCVFHRCDVADGSAPRSCREACADQHDVCTAQEDVKRPGTTCSAELMRCNARCQDAAAGMAP
jgi:hypothetical protein